MEERIALERLYVWLRDGGTKRAATMIGPNAESGWHVTIEDGRRIAAGEGKDFAELVNRLLAEMGESR